jgi:fructosamine-3-kinase
MDFSLQKEIEVVLRHKGYEETSIQAIHTVSGSSVNASYHIKTKTHSFFVKSNQKEAFPDLFEKEKSGLVLLASKSTLRVPQPIHSGSDHKSSFLIMEFIEKGSPTSNFWEVFAQGLAQMHRQSASFFGLSEDNYIGSLPQSNKTHSDWPSFFIEERLEKQHHLARDQYLIDTPTSSMLDALYFKLDQYFPREQAAFLHGDLWSGNFMCDRDGMPAIMDPAVYFGHREMDIAMSHLFGGFNAHFYAAYNELFPLESGWEERIDLCNLYPLLVHVNLFGAAYSQRLKSVLKRFV